MVDYGPPEKAFISFLTRELDLQGIDGDIYSPYFIGMLLEGASRDEIKSWLTDLNPSGDNDDSFCDKVMHLFSHRHEFNALSETVLPKQIAQKTDLEFDEALILKGLLDDEIDSQTEPLVSVERTDEVDTVPLSPLEQIDKPYTADDEIIEQSDDEIIDQWDVDWTQTSFKIEDELARECPTLQFSSGILFEAAYTANGNAAMGATLIKQTVEVLEASRPCRHMLAGRCMRSDCYFDHDVSCIPCRFWVQSTGCAILSAWLDSGYADTGEVPCSCPFLHTIPEYLIAAIYESDFSYESPTGFGENGPSLTNFDFPELAASSVGGDSGNILFPPLQHQPNKSISHGERVRGCGPNYAAVASRPPPAVPIAATSTSSPSWNVSQSITVGAPKKVFVKSMTSLPTEWVNSGASVASDYKRAREDARSLAIARNKMLEEATNAFRGGAKAQARNLSAQGQAFNLQMKELHRQAAQAIFSQRNSEMSISRGQLDLHGLHVAEATACLHELLPVLALSPVAKAPITIVTGSGHHSVGGQKGKPRLLPAVQGVLDELGYEYQLVKDVNGFVSGVNVRLR